MAKCKSCGAEIRWIVTSGGKKMPLDAKPKMVYVETSKGHHLMKGHESHFATCPHADKHRKG